MEDLIDAGLESANPVQITCNGMDPAHLKKSYGDRLVFWSGGCDTPAVLPAGTPEEVRQNVGRYAGWRDRSISAVPPTSLPAVSAAEADVTSRLYSLV